MEIRTKFDINDRVWGIDCIDDKWVADDEFLITQIIINRDYKSKKEQIVYVEYQEFWHSEENCFATEEEAIKECDRRNGQK